MKSGQLAILLAITALLLADDDTAKLTVRPFLTGAEVDDKASLTADGRWMATTDWGSGDIAIRDMSTGERKRVMAKTGGWESDDVAEYPVLSPDLQQAVYLWNEAGRSSHLRVISTAPGSMPRVLVKNPEFAYIIPTAWSHDGKSVLVHIWKVDYTAQIAWVSVADGSIVVLRSLDWRKPIRPNLSPDGRFITYSALAGPDSEDSHIYVLAANGASETELIAHAGVNQSPVWSPDGSRILFIGDRSGAFDLWSVAVRNGKAAGAPKLMKSGIGKIFPIGIAPSGSFYYVHEQAGEHVLVADLEPGGKTVRSPAVLLTEKFTGFNRAPAWSPDGKSVAFRRRNQGNRPGYDLVVHSLETGKEKTYPSNSMTGSITHPSWFQDGKSLMVAMSDNQQRVSFHRLDLSSGKFSELLAPDTAYLSTSALSPDGKTLYVTVRDDGNKTGGVAAYNLPTGGYRRVFMSPGFVNNFALSRDGGTLAVTRSVPAGRLWQSRLSAVSVDGGDFRDLHIPEAGAEQDVFGGGPMVAWSSDGQAIFFAAGSRQWRLMRIPTEGGQAEFTGLITEGLQHDLTVSPDGSRIAFSHGKFSLKETRVLEGLAVDAKPASQSAVPAPPPSTLVGLDVHVPGAEGTTPEKISLGEKLFFDKNLSLDGTLSCGGCHDPAKAFSDGRPVAVGVGQAKGTRNSPAIVNRGYGRSFFWDGRAATLEQQVLEPIFNPIELGLTRAELESRTGLAAPQVAEALASYVRTIRSGNSAYDRYTMGQAGALSALEKAGLELFRGKGHCVTCHVGPNFTDEQFHNTGVAWRVDHIADQGRERGAFKTPTLREVARTAPYMHDGSLPTLEGVVDFYSEGGRSNPYLDPEMRPRRFTAAEKRALIAFLQSLSGRLLY